MDQLPFPTLFPRAILAGVLALGASSAMAAGTAGTGTTSEMTAGSSSGSTARPPGQRKPDPDSDAARRARSDPRAEGSGSKGGNTNPAPTGPQDPESTHSSVEHKGKQLALPRNAAPPR